MFISCKKGSSHTDRVWYEKGKSLLTLQRLYIKKDHPPQCTPSPLHSFSVPLILTQCINASPHSANTYVISRKPNQTMSDFYCTQSYLLLRKAERSVLCPVLLTKCKEGTVAICKSCNFLWHTLLLSKITSI